MRTLQFLAAAGFALAGTFANAQLPGGVTPEMIATALPEEGAPKAIPGAHAVTGEPAFGQAGLKLFRPTELAHFPAREKLPVVVWGNGGCAIDNPRYDGLLQTIASHGFLVITTTAPAPAGNAGAAPRAPQATAASLKAGIDWAEVENRRAGAPLAGKIDTTQVAVMGQSCGGRLSIELGVDPRVRTIGVFNAGVQPAQYDLLPKLHGPVLFLDGHERDFATPMSKATYTTLETQPAFYGSRHGAGHTATAYHAGGGEFANVAVNWVRWWFKGDQNAARMFKGAQCTLCTDPHWDTESKRLPQ